MIQKDKFSLIRQAKSFNYAGRGIYVVLRTTPNAWIHLTILAIVVVLGFFFHISRIEWMMLVFVAGLVLAAEAFNTAIDIDIELTSHDYHPYARDTKDVAAGAVLISAITAAIIGLIIFVPHILAMVGM